MTEKKLDEEALDEVREAFDYNDRDEDGLIDLEEFGTECFRPQLEDPVNTVAREPGAQQPRRRQSAPGRVTGAWIP